MSKPRLDDGCGTKLRRNLITGGAASGMRGGLSLPRRRLSGTWEPESSMLTEKPQVLIPRGREYGCGDSGAEQRVVAMKSPIKGWSKGAVSRSLSQPVDGRSPMKKAKPFCISKKEVWEAYQRVKANKGAAGTDGQSIEDFERKLKKNLYKIW